MIQLPRWVLTNPTPAVYDTESATSIEMVAKLYGAMQTLIDEYNKFAENTEKTINDFMSDEASNRQVFEIAMRQEFQDFIDVIELRLQSIENDVISHSKDILNEAIKNGKITVSEYYDEATESLYIVGEGEV